MQTLFQYEAEGHSPECRDDALPAPSLLVAWPSWPRVFFGNLRDLLAAPFRREPPLELSSRPAAFWPDVFVHRRMPLAPLRQSALYHVFAVVSIWGLSYTWLARPHIQPLSPFKNARVTYYPVSAYLPPLVDEAEPGPARAEKKGAPVRAQQRIRSIPRRPDNTRQTIITPSPLAIHSDVPLPNIVAWNESVPPAPVAAAASLRARPAMPLQASPVPPAPLAIHRPSSVRAPEPVAVAPPPAVNLASSRPKLELPAPVLPAPLLKRPLGDPRVAQIVPSEALPRLPVAERSVVPLRPAGRRREVAEMAAVPAPALQNPGAKDAEHVRQLVALGIHPVVPEGPLRPPEGNRRGTFEARPEGRPEASGAPDVHAERSSDGANKEPGTRTPLAGVTVENPPVQMASVRPSTPSVRDLFAQQLARARALDIPRPRPTSAAGPEPKVEDFGAGPKRYYSMVLNMPNLTSSGGSWIIHFAELHESQDHSPVTAPMVTVKVDPAYPTELLRNHVEGVVLLYAVIRADGSVGAVRVLRGVDSRLDASASAALQKWRFRPGTRKGSAVDLEAVVQIPFKTRPLY